MLTSFLPVGRSEMKKRKEIYPMENVMPDRAEAIYE